MLPLRAGSPPSPLGAAEACFLALTRLPGPATTSRVCGATGTPAYRSAACSLHRLCGDSGLVPAIWGHMCGLDKVWATLCLEDPEIRSLQQCQE